MDHNTPDFRATLRPRGPVRLVEWGPWLAAGGPLHTLLDARAQAGIAIADFTVIRDSDGTARELIIEFLAGDSPQHRATISTWAAGVGYSRVWFPGDVADLDPVPGGPAETRCTGCRVRLVDSDASFWEFVRHHGAFPATCVLCGSDLPQWRPVRPVCLDETEGSPVAGRSGRAV